MNTGLNSCTGFECFSVKSVPTDKICCLDSLACYKCIV